MMGGGFTVDIPASGGDVAALAARLRGAHAMTGDTRAIVNAMSSVACALRTLQTIKPIVASEPQTAAILAEWERLLRQLYFQAGGVLDIVSLAAG